MPMKKKYVLPIGLATVALSVGLMNSQSLATVFAQTSTQQPAVYVQKMHRKKLPEMFKNVDKKVENISNGVKMTLSSTDTAVVAKLQSMQQPPASKDSKVTVTRTNIANGVEVTMTSNDADTVKKIQTGHKFVHRGFDVRRSGLQGKNFLGKNVEKKVENITNGVKITMTSTDAAIVTKLQSMKHPGPKEDAKVTVTQTNISNGVEVTLTSTDSATVQKLQERKHFHSDKREPGKFRHFMKKTSR